MTQEQKQKLRDALMSGQPDTLTPEELVMVSDGVDKDLEKIEPVLDAMLESARKGSNPIDWTQVTPVFEFTPDGASFIVEVTAGIRRFTISITREQMINFGRVLIQEAQRRV